MNGQIQQKILEDLESLDAFELAEVVNFVAFLKQRQREVPHDYRIIDTLYGKYKQHLSSSQEFAHRKQEEIALEEEKWQMQ